MHSDLRVFSTVALASRTIQELVRTLPCSHHTIYKSIERLTRASLLSKQRRGKQILVSVAQGYRAAKLRDLCIKALSRGIDPAQLLAQSQYIAKLAGLDIVTAVEVQNRTGLSRPTALKVMKSLESSGLARLESARPLTIRIDKSSEVLATLMTLAKPDRDVRPSLMLEERPYLQSELPPEDLERKLYATAESKAPVAIEGTSFVTRGHGRLELLTPLGRSNEERFIRYLMTPDGVEDSCIRMLRANQINHPALLEEARRRNMVNIVGCYLQILHDIDKNLVSKPVAELFRALRRKGPRHVFLKQLKPLGKESSLENYEREWNLDLYLDFDAITHGVGSR